MSILASVLNEGCDRHGITSPSRMIKPLKQKRTEVFPFTLSISGAQDELLASRKPNAPEFGFLAVDDVARTITIKPGAWKVDRTMVLPAGYRRVAHAPLELDIVNGAEIISYATLDWKGQGGEYVEVFSTDSSSHGVHVIDAVGNSTLDHLIFRSLPRYNSEADRLDIVRLVGGSPGQEQEYLNQFVHLHGRGMNAAHQFPRPGVTHPP